MLVQGLTPCPPKGVPIQDGAPILHWAHCARLTAQLPHPSSRIIVHMQTTKQAHAILRLKCEQDWLQT